MDIYKTRQFDKWANKEGLNDAVLVGAIQEMQAGLIDADLGGHVVKKRIALPGRGKSGGSRTLLAYQQGVLSFFLYGYAKNESDNITDKELKVLKQLASSLLNLTIEQLLAAESSGKLLKVNQVIIKVTT